jgi:hypothetical protein
MVSLANMHFLKEIHVHTPGSKTWNAFLAVMATLPENNTVTKIRLLDIRYMRWDCLSALTELDILLSRSQFRCVEQLLLQIRHHPDPEQRAQDISIYMSLATERSILVVSFGTMEGNHKFRF